MNTEKSILSYSDAGVDIDAGNTLVEEIKPAVAMTKRPGVMSNIGGFGGLFDLKNSGYNDPILVSATDGVGTKLKLAIEMNNYGTIGQDLVAMCVNDLICQGAEPLFFLDYFATGKLDVLIAKKIIIGIANACKSSNCALIGGETAEMPGVYRGGDFDLAGFAVGALERGKTLPTGISTGDAVIALPSSGIHSNGFSLVRKVISKSGLTWFDKAPFDTVTLGNIFLRPTQLYVLPVLKLINENLINGVAHITGGGLTENIPRILDGNMGIFIDTSTWEFPSEFKWLKSAGNIEQAEMLKTFNCGIGMVLVINKRAINNVLSLLKNEDINAFQIGEITNSGKLEYHGLTS
jgi:phosphoribosylformylglycinamidine cyclo-ligase